MGANDQRDPKYSLQLLGEIDAFERAAIGASAYDCESGSFSNRTDAEAKVGFFCRSIYNSTAAEITVNYKLFGDSTTYLARIPAATWFHCYSYIQSIPLSGSGTSTSSATVTLGYVKRGKVTGSATGL